MHRCPDSLSRGRVASQVDVALAAAAVGDASENVDEVLVRAPAVESFRRSTRVARNRQLRGRTH